MSDIRELYQELIIDHGTRPRNHHALAHPTCIQLGHNPLCGDKIKLYLKINTALGIIEDLSFEGEGCAISMASTSLMIELMKGKTLQEAEHLFAWMHHMLTDGTMNAAIEVKLGKLSALRGVFEYPARVKCASLAWHTLKAGLSNEHDPIKTE
jgi:nitrogen fixation protein NifU and related proteins